MPLNPIESLAKVAVGTMRRIRQSLLILPAVLMFSGIQPVQAGWNDFSCSEGTEIQSSNITIASASGGWLEPLADAARLLDGTWAGWAPNYSGNASTVLTLSAPTLLGELQVFIASSTGNINVTTQGVTNTLEFQGGYRWYTLPVNRTVDSIALSRDTADDNIVELRLCALEDGGIPVNETTEDMTPVGDVDVADTEIPDLPQTNSFGQLITAQLSGLPRTGAFDHWSMATGVKGTLSEACIDLHDSFWIKGTDNKAYPTWHPAGMLHPETGEGCVFGHEHGDDPSTAPDWLFAYSGGWPPFGYVQEQNAGMRHEDHFGHKVTVTRFRAAIGNTANSRVAVYDAGFDCNFISKIHQGSYSADAMSNHLHEYFLTIACDDDPGKVNNRAIRTLASVKTLLPFGEPNRFNNNCLSESPEGNAVFYNYEVLGLDGETTLKTSQQEWPVAAPIALNDRGFGCVNAKTSPFIYGSPEYLDSIDLWHQIHSVKGPGNVGLEFNPYYIVKDAVRVHTVPVVDGKRQNGGRLQYTIDACADLAASKLAFCEGSYKADGSVHSAFSTESPFRGALRAINFKSFNIYSNSTSRPVDGFCTDTYGNYLPTATLVGNICSEGIYQRITNTFNGNSNMWSWMNPETQIQGQVTGALRIYGQDVRYPNPDLTNNPQQPFIEGLKQPDANGMGCPRGAVTLPAGASKVDKAYCPTGIGFERIIDHRNSVPQQVKDKVAVNPVTGEQYNTDLHAPN